MRKLALHFTHPQSFIGIIDEEEQIGNVLTVDNILLFKQPSLLAKRVREIAKSYTNSSKKFDKITLSFNGELDIENKEIIHNEDLDYVSYTESYDGYSFKEHFASLCKKSGELILQDHYITYEKSIETFEEIFHPTLFFYDDLSFGVGAIQPNRTYLEHRTLKSIKDNFVRKNMKDDKKIALQISEDNFSLEIKNKYPKEQFEGEFSAKVKKSLEKYLDEGYFPLSIADSKMKNYEALLNYSNNKKLTPTELTDMGIPPNLPQTIMSRNRYENFRIRKISMKKIIYEIAIKKSNNIVWEYSKALKNIVKFYLKQMSEIGYQVETICIISNQTTVISKRMLLGSNMDKYKLIIEPIDSSKRNFPMAGCGMIFKNTKPKLIHDSIRLKAKRTDSKENRFSLQIAEDIIRDVESKIPLAFEIIRIEYLGYEKKLLNEFFNYNNFIEHFKEVKKHNRKESSYAICFSESEKIHFSIEDTSKLALWKIKDVFVEKN